MKTILLFFGIFTMLINNSSAQGYQEISAIELPWQYSPVSMEYTKDGKNMIMSTDLGEVIRYDLNTQTEIWKVTVNQNRQTIYIQDISPDGQKIMVTSKLWSVGATNSLVILSISDGSTVKTIDEESLYVQDPLKAEDMDLRKKESGEIEEYPDYEMACFGARYLPDGKIMAMFFNFKTTFGQFDRCFKLYSSNYQELWHWQIISLNNFSFRNGLQSSYPSPSIDADGKGNFYYGDSDADFYFLTESHIKSQESKLYITDKTPGQKLAILPVQENIGLKTVRVIGNDIYLFYKGSGAPTYVQRYSALTKKPTTELKEMDSMYSEMMVSPNGNFCLENMNTFEIFDRDFNQIASISGSAPHFNPNQPNQVIYYDRGTIRTIEIE